MAEWVAQARSKAAEHTVHWTHPAAVGEDRTVLVEGNRVERGGSAAELKSEIVEMREMMKQLLQSQAEQGVARGKVKVDRRDGLTEKGLVLVTNELGN
jgi:hypothetical protein